MVKQAQIIQLPDTIANQIAAGEVVEGPAAAVKELVENSIDAGAKAVHIVLEDGGRRLLEITDDGHGIPLDQLRLALGRHATSKLKSADDLFCVSSLGFRGEALPSIAAVSEFTLASRPTNAQAGQLYGLAGGVEKQWQAVAMPPGTRVSVRNLFWNVPARLKFLKSARSETSKVSDIVTRLALGHPHIAFSLRSDGRVLLDLAPVQELGARIRQCFGPSLADGLLTMDGSADGLQISGLIAHPSQAKPSTKRQYVFLNGRCIQDKLVIAALREGYHGHLEPRLHPCAFIHLDIDPSLVDVNVHPTKAEVRFRRGGEIFSTLRQAIHNALDHDATGHGMLSHAPQVQRRVVKPGPAPEAPSVQERFLPHHAPEVFSDKPEKNAEVIQDSTHTRQQTEQPVTRANDQVIAYNQHASGVTLPKNKIVRQIVQLRESFILVETAEGIRLVDQHALHEKILWLCLGPEATAFEDSGTQELLIPKQIDLTAIQMSQCEPHLAKLGEYGILAEIFGPTTIAIRAFPTMLARTNWNQFFADLAEHGSHDDAVERLREAIGHRKACRAAVKAGDRLTSEEQANLIDMLQKMESLENCPHGRPTTLDLSWTELERRFQR